MQQLHLEKQLVNTHAKFHPCRIMIDKWTCDMQAVRLTHMRVEAMCVCMQFSRTCKS